MFKSIGTTLITGFITILPVVLTMMVLRWLPREKGKAPTINVEEHHDG